MRGLTVDLCVLDGTGVDAGGQGRSETCQLTALEWCPAVGPAHGRGAGDRSARSQTPEDGRP